MKSINVSDENWERLTRIKLDKKFKTMDDLISSLINNTPKR